MWSGGLNVFDDHPVMRQIDSAGELVRQRDKELAGMMSVIPDGAQSPLGIC
jgi:hypothetical protein